MQKESKRGFPEMAKLLRPVQKGAAKLDYVTVSPEAASEDNLRWAMEGAGFMAVEPGTYARLRLNNVIQMTDTPMERLTNGFILSKAHGHVLIGGLGIGMILLPLLSSPLITRVTVIEKSQDVIDIIEPQIRARLNGNGDKLEVINANIFTWSTDQKFNCIYFDIWPEIVPGNYPEMRILHSRYRRNLDQSDPECWIDSWMYGYIREKLMQEFGLKGQSAKATSAYGG